MITGDNLDRRYWIGASDTYMVTGNHETASWDKWWKMKMGIVPFGVGGGFSNIYTVAGDIYEKPIANAFNEDIIEDRTILLPEYSLRVNLDADTIGKIIECKTYKSDKGTIDTRGTTYKRYAMQIQVQLFAWKEAFGDIVDGEMRIYYLLPEDYEAASRGYPLEIDYNRMESKIIKYNPAWIHDIYLPNLMPLAELLKKEREREYDSEG